MLKYIYHGGVFMGLLEVVKYDGIVGGNWLVYKVEGHEFNTKSKLIVGVGQIAIVVHGGKIEKIFENGTYVLNSENLPIIKELVKSVHSGKSPFALEIYFFNKTIKLDMLWGTKDPVAVIDPKYQVKVRARARGQFGIRITDYQLFLTQLVGTLGGRTIITFEATCEFFRALINTKIKTLLAEYFIKNNVSVMDISLYLEQLSKQCKENITDDFEKFGFEIINFYVESVNVPDEDLAEINRILNKKAEFEIMGDSRYKTARGYDVLETAAGNEGGAGGIAAAGVGLGLGLGAAQSVGQMVNSNVTQPTGGINCRKCGCSLKPNAKFCPECGERVATTITCAKCNAQVAADAKFCPECGSKI